MCLYFKRRFTLAILCALSSLFSADSARAAWPADGRFRVGDVNGAPRLIAPDGKPFKSVGMVWAYGPDREPYKQDVTPEWIIEQLRLMKDLGFNTLNLYGDRHIPEMLEWCDENEMAVYFRTAHYSVGDFPGDLSEFPDYMDPAFRAAAKAHYNTFLQEIKGHPSVLAVDMDHRWLFRLDWAGARRFDTPKLREHAVRHFPRWLARRYGNIDALNEAWGCDYANFEAVLEDQELIKEGRFLSLGEHPARVDTFLYTLWTPSDFLHELSMHMQKAVPGVLITPTTEHPECIPDINTPPEQGVAFISPVHYNQKPDFERDLPALCKLIYETRWHYDLQGGPVYISETGWRTDPLEQDPPAETYAWMQPPTEETAAMAYAKQFALLNVMPWIGGYGYFKLYDKLPEGDFGYLRDNGEKKPMARVGDAINRAFGAATLADKEPAVWIYYPDHALATRAPGFQQLKTLVYALEKPFLDALDASYAAHRDGLLAGDREAGEAFAEDVQEAFMEMWTGFAFTRTLPDDNRPVILLSTISEILTQGDRALLRERPTIAFGHVGTSDRYMKPTLPWQLGACGLETEDLRESYLLTDLDGGGFRSLGWPEEAGEAVVTNAPWSLAEGDPGLADTQACSGQVLVVPEDRYKRIDVLAVSGGGNGAPFCTVRYVDGSTERVPMGPTISDARFTPVMTPYWEVGDAAFSRISVPLEPGKRLASVTWPKATWVRVAAVALVKGGEAEDVSVTYETSDGDVTGVTPWQALVKPAVVPPAEVLAESAAGDVLLVGKDRHAAFFFDPLTWEGRSDEFSRHVGAVEQLLGIALKYVNGEHDE